VLSVLLAFLSASFGTAGAQSDSADRAPTNTASDHNTAPLAFIANVGQLEPSVHFTARDNAKTLWFAADGVTLNLPAVSGPDSMVSCANPNMQIGAPPIETQTMLRLAFDNANPNLALEGTNQFPGMANLFTDGSPLEWRPNEARYAGVLYRDLYPGIALSFRGQAGKLTATYTLAAGIDPALIAWHYLNADSLYTNAATGDLHIYTSDGGLLMSYAPVAWQMRNGTQMPVNIGYQTTSDNVVRFAIPLTGYDPTLPFTLTLRLD
jgi:hypothetical protein